MASSGESTSAWLHSLRVPASLGGAVSVGEGGGRARARRSFRCNHPGGTAAPSQADLACTKRLCDALALIDVRVVDHIIVTAEKTSSFADKRLLARPGR
jgi:hypothetical protein